MKLNDTGRFMTLCRRTLWKLYICAIPFQRLWDLPYVGHQFQLPEIIFLPFLANALPKLNRMVSRSFWGILDIVVLLWPFVKLVPCIHNGIVQKNILDIAGAVYLVTLYFLIRLLVDRDFLKQTPVMLSFSALVAGVLGGIGWSLSMFLDIHTKLTWPATIPYPYLGYIARAQAFTASPNMLAGILQIGIIFQYALFLSAPPKKRKTPWMLVILLACFVLTFSKTIMCLLAGLIVTTFIHYAKAKPQTWGRSRCVFISGLVLFCIAAYTFGAHVVISEKNPEKLAGFYEKSYISKEALWSFDFHKKEYGIYPTNYLHNKLSSLRAVIDSRGWGVGPGGYNSYIGTLQQQGKHPAEFPQWDPHSTYFGIAAELGMLGLVELLCIWGFAARIILTQLRHRTQFDPLVTGLAGIFIAIAIEAIGTDIMNFRQYWWLLAITSGLDYVRKHQEQGIITATPEP